MSNFIDLTGQKFGEWIVLRKSDKVLIDSYNKKKIYWVCQCSCGAIFDVQGNSLRSGKSTRCRQCANQSMKSDKLKNQQQNKKKIIKTKKQKIKQQPNNTVLNHPRLKDISNTKYKYFTVISYHHSDTKKQSYWLCKCFCGNNFIATKTAITHNEYLNCGCLKTKSKGENKIIEILNKNNINYKTEYSFSDLYDIKPLRFDFAIFNNNNDLIKLIEFQGEQHYDSNPFYKSPQLHDQLKIEYCKKNHIKLLIIPYWDYNKIDINYLLNK